MGAWPPMPDWLRLALAPAAPRRGERVRVRWKPSADAQRHDLLLALIVHRKQRASTLELPDAGGRFGIEQQIWAVRDRAPVDGGGEALLRVPADAPYSYAGTILGFFWGVALAAPDTPIDRPVGWAALRVLP